MKPVAEGGTERAPQIGQRHAVLRSPWASDRGPAAAEAQAQRLTEAWLDGVIGPEEALLPGIGVDTGHRLGRPPGHAQVAERLVVHRKEGRGGAELRAHVADRGGVGPREGRESRGGRGTRANLGGAEER